MSRTGLGKCRLCLREGNLSNSHVIPEFLYLPMYDEKHRLLQIPADSSRSLVWQQKGLREHMLCALCENQLSRYEDYANHLLNGGPLPVTTTENTEFHAVCENVDYRMFKLFQMSILWRAGVAASDFFRQVVLDSHGERLRAMLLADDPGQDQEYGCAMMALRQGDQILDMVRSPQRVEIGGNTCFRFIMGGFMWFFVGSEAPLGDELRVLFLQGNGRLPILKDDPRNLEFFELDRRLMAARRPDVEALTKKRKNDRKNKRRKKS
jgi:hypothetical protein